MITSKANPRIKFIRKLRDKKYREMNNLFYIEGIRIVSEALQAGWIFETVVIAPELVKDGYSQALTEEIRNKGIPFIEVDAEVFKSISVKDGPKGLAAVLTMKFGSIDDIQNNEGVWVALDRVQDPGNLGTIMRTVDSVGAKGVILIDNCTDPFDISTIRASMGAIFDLNVIKVNEEDFFSFIKENQVFTVGTSDRGAVDYQKVSYPENMILLMGSEREGLSDFLMAHCDRLVRIPMAGKSDSLNLAVATSVALYEIFNQHRSKEEI